MTDDEYDAAMQPYRDRLKWNVQHLFDRGSFNPYLSQEEHGVDEQRTGWQDLSHSIKNVWKESRRLRGKSKWIE